MKTGKIKKPGRWLRLAILCTWAGAGHGTAAQPAAEWRNPTREELLILSDVAKRRPLKSRFLAEIELSSMPPLPEAGTAEVRMLTPDQVQRWRAMHEKRQPDIETKNVAQWYAKWYFRTDESYGSVKANSGKKFAHVQYPLRFVELFDASLSPYNRYIFNEHSRVIQVDRHPGNRLWADDLWAAACMDPDLLHPVLSSLTTLQPDELVELARKHFYGIEKIAIDEGRVEALVRGAVPRWTAQARREAGDALWIKLTGKLALKTAEYDVDATYCLQQVNNGYVLLTGRVENQTLRTIFTSRRSEFDSNLVARQWSHSRSFSDGRHKSAEIRIETADLTDSWAEDVVFKPATAETHPDYRISDITSGKALPVHQPKSRPSSAPPTDTIPRVTVIGLGFTLLAAAALLTFASYKRSASLRQTT